MAAHRFAVNLRPETVSRGFRAALKPSGYLVPGNAPASIRGRARDLGGEGVDILADNGHFDDIGRIATMHIQESEELRSQVRIAEEQLGHDVRPGDLDAGLRDRYRDLAVRARTESLLATTNRPRTIAEQQTSSPTRMIGIEDISMAVWLALNSTSSRDSKPGSDSR
jgi:hypothetical protein